MFLTKLRNIKNTLLFRLIFLYAVIFMLSWLVTFFMLYYRIYSVSIERLDQDLVEDVDVRAADIAEKGFDDVMASIAEEAELENPHEEFFRLLNSDGEVLFSNDMSSWGPLDTYAVPEAVKNEKSRYVLQTITIPGRGDKARVISARIAPDTVLQIGEVLTQAYIFLDIFRDMFTFLIVHIIVVSVIMGWFMARRALNHVEDVTRTAEKISKGAYDQRVQVKGRFEEIKRLGSSFNHMLDRIQNLMKSMEQINDNIAHELRSPLARIRGISEMTLIGSNSMEDYKNMAVSTIEECDSLIDMINTMLDITEAEGGVNHVTIEEFDLVALILDAGELFRPLADEEKIELKISRPERLTFWGDRKKMQRIVTNMLENALKYTPAQGTVCVSLAQRDGRVQIDFTDTGIGISEDDLPHIFERFYRCERSRPHGGSGLGLSLAKVYIRSMNGSITVNSTLNQGSTFSLSFPIMPS